MGEVVGGQLVVCSGHELSGAELSGPESELPCHELSVFSCHELSELCQEPSGPSVASCHELSGRLEASEGWEFP